MNWACTPRRYSFNWINYSAERPNPARPSRQNLLGTDDRGRDVLARLIYGFRISVLFALALTIVGTLVGILRGRPARLLRRRFDLLFQRFMEVWGSMPELYLLIIFSAIFQPSIGLLLDPAVAVRLDGPGGLRARRIPARRNMDLRPGGARAGGVEPRHILRHLLPNSITPARQSSCPSVVRRDPGADQPGFLGLGVPPSTPQPGRTAGAGQGQHRAPGGCRCRPSWCWSAPWCC